MQTAPLLGPRKNIQIPGHRFKRKKKDDLCDYNCPVFVLAYCVPKNTSINLSKDYLTTLIAAYGLVLDCSGII